MFSIIFILITVKHSLSSPNNNDRPIRSVIIDDDIIIDEVEQRGNSLKIFKIFINKII